MKKPRYIIGDCRNLESIIKIKAINKPKLIITSPPYFNIKNYGEKKNQIGFGQSYSDYLKDTTNVLQKCYDLSDQNATLWMITDSVKKDGIVTPIPFDINNSLKEQKLDTWKLKEIIIWDKTKNLPWNAKGRLKNQFEYITFYTKNEKYLFNIDKVRDIFDLKKWWLTYPERYNPNGKPPSNIWEFTIPIRGWGNGCLNHLCPFPFPLVERIISLSSNENDLVFDPFAGSGSVLAMANAMNRQAIGLDLNEIYQEKFYSEVLKGAKLYWKFRKIEIDNANNKIQEFKLNNDKLRKNKLALIVMQSLKENKLIINNYKLVTIEDNKSIIILLIGDNKVTGNINFNSQNIEEIKHQFKLEINYKVVDPEEFELNYKNMTFFQYLSNNFHKYQNKIDITEIINDKSTNFVTNIKLNINSYNDFFNTY